MLRQRARSVTAFDSYLPTLIRDMADTMYKSQGIGLAANQIGILKRVIVADVGSGLVSVINPVIIASEGEQLAAEGCLSVPGVRLWVRRSQRVVVRGYDSFLQVVELSANGLLARCLQHEIDHLDGVLITDRQYALGEEAEMSYGDCQHA